MVVLSIWLSFSNLEGISRAIALVGNGGQQNNTPGTFYEQINKEQHSKMTDFETAQPGELITFGGYPHTTDGTDSTPVQWRVLHNAGQDLFVLSEYILDCRRYHGEYADTIWRDCDLRRWLNDGFYSTVFTAAEQERITTTCCTDNGEGTPDTEDRIFLLSVAEVKDFTDTRDGHAVAIRRRTTGTAFARARKPDGCHLYVYDKGVERDYVIQGAECSDRSTFANIWIFRIML